MDSDNTDEVEDSAAPTNVEVGSTKFGKKINIRKQGNGQFWVIDFEGNARKPKELSGKFTNVRLAEHAVQIYENKNKSRPKSKQE